jgi:hypothetical protein
LVLVLFVLIPRAAAAPIFSATYSHGSLTADERVIVEAVFSWPSEEGNYEISGPEWALDNLVFYRDTRLRGEFAGADGKPWQRIKFRYEFKPVIPGKAMVKFIRFAYLNSATQETGHATVVRQIEYRILRRRDYMLMFSDMLCLMSGVLFAGALLILFHTQYAAKKGLAEAAAKQDSEYAEIPLRIEKAAGSQKEQVFEWGNQFKVFLIYRYRLEKKFMTEQEAVALASNAPGVSERESKKIIELSDRLFSAKFSTRELEAETFRCLKKDLLDFTVRRMKVEETSPYPAQS